MGRDEVILWQGTLATPRRSVLGVLGHLAQLELTTAEARTFLVECGLPPLAMEEPDIPIAFAKQLLCLSQIVERLDRSRSLPCHATELGIDVSLTSFGVLGLAALHAPDVPTAMRLFWTCPELSWGNSSFTVRLRGKEIVQTFAMDPTARQHIPVSVGFEQYCVAVDLAATVRLVQEIIGPSGRPNAASLPYPAPRDADRIVELLACPVRFGATEACLFYDAALFGATPLRANPLIFRVYEKLTQQLAMQLRTDVSLSDQVRRILRMSTPPPDRESVASMLAMSPRTLARKLAAEDASYAVLQRESRLARAEEYLRDPAQQMNEIAARLGFSDAAAFSRAFRLWRGTTPSAWRERRGDAPSVYD